MVSVIVLLDVLPLIRVDLFLHEVLELRNREVVLILFDFIWAFGVVEADIIKAGSKNALIKEDLFSNGSNYELFHVDNAVAISVEGINIEIFIVSVAITLLGNSISD